MSKPNDISCARDVNGKLIIRKADVTNPWTNPWTNPSPASSCLQQLQLIKDDNFSDPRLKLSKDFNKLFNSNKFSDVTIVLSKSEFHAHKAILSVRSPVFFAMFEHEMAENSINKVIITDIKDDVFQEMLIFMYTGSVNNLHNVSMELLIAAEKYALEDLKNICEFNLSKQLTVNNATNTLVMADLHNAKYLKLYAIEFINENASQVIKTKGYELLVKSSLHLVEELYRNQHNGMKVAIGGIFKSVNI